MTFKIQSKKFGELCVIVDNEDYPVISKYNWYANSVVDKRLKNPKPYVATKINGKTVLLHRFILGCPKYKSVDHIDNNPLNNQKENLRICTHQQNHFNRPANFNGSSKYKGVCWDKKHNSWKAQIKTNKKNKYLGLFKTEKEAAKAYNTEAFKLFGEYAYQNKL